MTEAQIKAIIDENIRTNGREEITGAIANNVLNAMVDYTTTVVTPTIDVSGSISLGQVTKAVNGDKVYRHTIAKSVTKWDNTILGAIGGYARYDIVFRSNKFYISNVAGNMTDPSTDITDAWSEITSSGNYVLPTATETILGGVKVGANLSIDSNGVLSATGGGTTYTAGNGISISDTVISANFGTTSTTVARGNDVRILNGATAYTWGNHANEGYATETWVEAKGYVTSVDIDNKVDKVTPSKLSYALITPTGTIQTTIPSLGIPIKMLGVDATNTPVTIESEFYSALSTEVTEPTILELEAFNTQEVHYPNQEMFCKKIGSRWFKFNGIEIL